MTGAPAPAERPQTAFLDLPPDMTRAILSFLDRPRDLAAFGATCTAGRAAAADDDLWAGLAAALAAGVALGPPPPQHDASPLARAGAAVGPLAAWAPAGVTSYKTLVQGLLGLRGLAWALAGPCTIAGSEKLAGLVCPRLVLPGSEPGADRGGLDLELRTPTTLGAGFDRAPLFRVEPGLQPAPDCEGSDCYGVHRSVRCLRTGRPTPGVVPLPGPHLAGVTRPVDPGCGGVVEATFACDGGCLTRLTTAQARVAAAMRTGQPPPPGCGPGEARGPPHRPGLPDYTSRVPALPALMRTLGRLSLTPQERRPSTGSRLHSEVTVRPLGPGWAGPPPGTAGRLPRLGDRLAGLWKGCYGDCGPEVVAITAADAGLDENASVRHDTAGVVRAAGWSDHPPRETAAVDLPPGRPEFGSRGEPRPPPSYPPHHPRLQALAVKVAGDWARPGTWAAFHAWDGGEVYAHLARFGPADSANERLAMMHELWQACMVDPAAVYALRLPLVVSEEEGTGGRGCGVGGEQADRPPRPPPVLLSSVLDGLVSLGIAGEVVQDPPDDRPDAAGLPVRVVAAHPAAGWDSVSGVCSVGCLLLELEGLEGEAFVLLSPVGERAVGWASMRASVFARVHPNEVMG